MFCISDMRAGDELDPRAPGYVENELDDRLLAIENAQIWLDMARRELVARGMNSTADGLIEDVIHELGGLLPGEQESPT